MTLPGHRRGRVARRPRRRFGSPTISCSGGSSFSTKPLAPARERLVDVLVEVERGEDRGRGPRRVGSEDPPGCLDVRPARACGCPSGSPSGRSERPSATASRPFAGLGDDLDVGLARPAACGSPPGPSDWSSATSTPILIGPRPSSGSRALEDVTRRRSPHPRSSRRRRCSRARGCRPARGRARRRPRPPSAVVAHFDRECVRARS